MRAPRRARNGPVLRPSAWRGLAIFLVLLILTTAGAMLAAIAVGAERTQEALANRVDRGVAVSLWGHGLESADAAAARAAEILQSRFGPGRVELLDPDARDPALARLAGAPKDRQAGARVIAVHRPGPGAAASLNAILRASALAGAAVDMSTRQRSTIVALAAASGVMLAAIAMVSLWAARSQLKANAAAVGLMLRFGAARERIAGLPQGRATLMLFVSALIGQGVAAHFSAWILHLPGPDLADRLWTGAFAVGAIIVGLLAAWLGARGVVRRLA